MGLTAYPPEEVVYKPGDVYMGVDFQMYRTGGFIRHIKAFDVANKE